MKVDRLEAHDRLEYFKKDQESNIFQGAEDCLKKNPLSLALQDKSPYIYIFAHPRTADDGINKRMLWQPRLTKPEPQTNSYLFRIVSHTDEIEVFWLLPPTEMWPQYKRGNLTEEDTVLWSINQFQHNRKRMGSPEHDDLPEQKVRAIYKEVVLSMRDQKQPLMMNA
jgi:hypothetical protein